MPITVLVVAVHDATTNRLIAVERSRAMRPAWPSTGRLDALISSTRRLNTRHEWFIRTLVALVALNIVLELHPLWSNSAPGTC